MISEKKLQTISGKPATLYAGHIVPSFWGECELHHTEDGIIHSINEGTSLTYIHDSQIDSIECSLRRNPFWMILGLSTIGLLGIGIIFIVMYFFMLNRCVLIYSAGNCLAIYTDKNDLTFHEFHKCTMVKINIQNKINQ